jgi:putative peptidoglycan lipid II flippase
VAMRRRSAAREVVRQSGLTSLAAAASVASGLVLDVAIAARFGAGPKTDAFFVSARIPLGIVAIVMVGANQALVPVISTWLVKRGERETWRLTSILIVAALGAGVVIAAVSALLAWPLMRLIAPGLTRQDLALAVSLSRVMFFVVPLVIVAETLRALLNARYSFVAPAAMNLVLNGVAAAIVITRSSSDPAVIAWGYLAGALAQLAFMLLVAFARGYRFSPTLAIRDPEVVAAGRLTVRPLIGAGLNPIARVGEQVVVSFLPPGSITILNYGYRLISAIGGTVLFRSIIVTLIPRLTEAIAMGRTEEVRTTTRLGLRIMLVVSIPLTALMAVLAEPATRAVFQRGDFSGVAAGLLGTTLAVYSASLVGSAVQRALLAPFFAAKDTRIPLANTVVGVVLNLALLPAFVLPWGTDKAQAIIGVAAAYSVAQYGNVTHAWLRVRRRFGIRLQGLGPMVIRLAAASILMLGVLIPGRWVAGLEDQMRRPELLIRTTLLAAAGVVVFVASLWAMGSTELRELRRRRAPIDGAGSADAEAGSGDL